MKVCFMCDLHLSFNRDTLQYKVLEWALEDAQKKKTDCIVFAGDVTADGNIDNYQYFLERVTNTGLPFLYIPGNSDLRDKSSKEKIYSNASATVTKLNGIKIFAINDSNQEVSTEQLNALEMACENDIVFMHHPLHGIRKESRERLLKWRKNYPKTMLFFGHLHRSEMGENYVSLQAMDPDKAIGESPCITYYDTETRVCDKAYYYCAVPADVYEYFGISCYKVEKEIQFAIEKGLKCLELRPNALNVDENKLIELILQWRKQGGKNLSIHLSEIYYENGSAFTKSDYAKLVRLGVKLKAERFTQHVPVVSVKTVKEDSTALDKIARCMANAFKDVPSGVIIGVENMHMTSKDEAGENRRFGYTPGETLLFMQRVQEKCTQRVGINFDIGHARNNAPYSQKYQISTWLSMMGKYIVGYHLHQVRENGGVFENHTEFDELYGRLISLASFFRAWSQNEIAHAPVIFEMRTENAYEVTLSTFAKHKEIKVIDLHSHTYYSHCSQDEPNNVVETAIINGVNVLGINDHNGGIGKRKVAYLQEMRALLQKYKDKIRILCGIEIATYPHLYDLRTANEIAEIKDYDYCLIEHITDDTSVVGKNLFEFCCNLGIPCGIAHTDLFLYCDKYGFEYESFFEKMAKQGIFWEMNVSYDSIHGYREHQYVKDFLGDERKLSIVRNAGVCISVGFDGHRYKDYDGFRVWLMNKKLKELQLKTLENHESLSKKLF